jgi:hypothetical protein
MRLGDHGIVNPTNNASNDAFRISCNQTNHNSNNENFDSVHNLSQFNETRSEIHTLQLVRIPIRLFHNEKRDQCPKNVEHGTRLRDYVRKIDISTAHRANQVQLSHPKNSKLMSVKAVKNTNVWGESIFHTHKFIRLFNKTKLCYCALVRYASTLFSLASRDENTTRWPWEDFNKIKNA